MLNGNERSIRIVQTWYRRATTSSSLEGSYNDFDRFISLWISFNCYFVAECYREVEKIPSENNDENGPSEWQYVKYLFNSEKYQKYYSELLIDYNFSQKIDNILDLLLTETKFKGRIANMQPGKSNKKDAAAKFTEKENFKQFLTSLYQVRCNLFHGNKDPGDKDSDAPIVKAYYDALMLFCKKIYETEGYL